MGAKRMAAKKRIGRPPKSEEDRKAVNFTFRSRGQMRERLREAATASRRSISEEIEHRLERSFQQQEIEKEMDIVTLQLRLFEGLWRRLEQAAKHHEWSVNTEIVSRLDVSFQRENEAEMIRIAAQEGVAAAKRFDEELSHRSADK